MGTMQTAACCGNSSPPVVICFTVYDCDLLRLQQLLIFCDLSRVITRRQSSSSFHHGTGPRTSGSGALNIMHSFVVTQLNTRLGQRIVLSAAALHSGSQTLENISFSDLIQLSDSKGLALCRIDTVGFCCLLLQPI